MLPRVDNVGSGVNFRKGDIRTGKFDKLFSGGVNEKIAGMNDSVVFSPAAQFLQKLDWELQEIRKTGNSRFVFRFMIGDIEFRTIIDTAELYHSEWQTFLALATLNIKAGTISCTCEYRVHRNTISARHYNTPDISHFHNYFIREFQQLSAIDTLPFSFAPQLTDSTETNNLINECANIFYGLLLLLEKLNEFEIAKFPQKAYNGQMLSIIKLSYYEEKK